MIWSGVTILAFIALHFIDFWFPEINTKYIQGDWSGMIDGQEGFRYHEELVHKFTSPSTSGAYVVAFIFLGVPLSTWIYLCISINGRQCKKKNISKYWESIFDCNSLRVYYLLHFTIT